MKNKIEKKEDEQNVNVGGLIIAILLIIALGVGGFFFYKYVIGPFITGFITTPDGEPADTTSPVQYNRLLQVLNSQVPDGDDKASSLISFTTSSHHLCISGYTGEYICYVDITTVGQEDTFNFVMDTDLDSGNSSSIYNRYTEKEGITEFSDKFVNSNTKGKYYLGNIGPVEKVFATLLNDQEISVFNGVDKTTCLTDGYTPTKVNSSDAHFPLYKYIASK